MFGSLARLVDEPTRSVLEKALALGTVVLALTIDDRERLLWALDDARTDALAELRAVVLNEHEGRVRQGLVWPPHPGRVDRSGVPFLGGRRPPSGSYDPKLTLRHRGTSWVRSGSRSLRLTLRHRGSWVRSGSRSLLALSRSSAGSFGQPSSADARW
jgi:hypothetical protein